MWFLDVLQIRTVSQGTLSKDGRMLAGAGQGVDEMQGRSAGMAD
jgi:hypothetical protein